MFSFYPRSPRGERHYTPSAVQQIIQFLSTLPARGATKEPALMEVNLDISIHAPREGSDIDNNVWAPSSYISIHAPREGSDCGIMLF